MSKVHISKGNSKMGAIRSVSLPAVVTCRECGCHKKCYARRIEARRKNVARSYAENLELLLSDPETYWREVEAAIMLSRFFRFHVSGDVPNVDYAEHMIDVASRNPHCQILCFTKRYSIWNVLSETKDIPANLHVIFSAWPGLLMDNPRHFPEAHVLFRDGTTTAREDAVPCGGNCAECAVTCGGCWTLGRGDQVVFNEH
jgi:hypothetical protein